MKIGESVEHLGRTITREALAAYRVTPATRGRPFPNNLYVSIGQAKMAIANSNAVEERAITAPFAPACPKCTSRQTIEIGEFHLEAGAYHTEADSFCADYNPTVYKCQLDGTTFALEVTTDVLAVKDCEIDDDGTTHADDGFEESEKTA